MKLTLAEWIIRLTKGYKKATGKEPDGLAKLNIKMEAGQKVKDQEKVIDITSKIKDEWWKARPTKEGGITTVHHLRDPLKKYRDRIKPGSLLEDQAKTDPYAAKTHIVWSDFTDARIESISKNNKKINYKKMEDILETKLKGNETWDDLMTIRDRKFPIPEPEDMASGGIARVGYAAGKIVKGGAWVIKNLKKSRKEVIEGTGRFKNLNSMQQDLLKKELSALIKQLEQGGAIPDEMLQTMRQDKRFKDIVKTPSTDPELRELEEVLLRGQTSDDYLEALDKSIMETMDLTKADLENMSSTVLDDLRRNADPIGMHKHFDEITPGRGVGDFPDDPSKHEDILPDLEQFDVTGKTKHASGGIAGELHLNEGGRVPMIFGGSAGLKGAIAAIKAAINKGRKTKIKTLFPKYSADEKELLKLGEKYLPRDAANLAAQEAAGKAEGVQVLIDRLKHDKKILEQMAKNKSMNDPGLDFMMKHLEETMYPPHLKKYKNIDKDILQLETIKKNLIMKGRKPNAEGGLAHVLGV